MKDKEINSVSLALKCIMASTTNCLVFFNLKKSKELKNKKLARQRYCQSICLFFGCIAPIIEDQSENELVSFIQTVTHLFNSSMKKIHGDLFYELDLEPNSEGGFSNLNAEIGRWFFDNSSNPNVASIVNTGRHMMYASLNGNKIDDDTISKFNKAGSLFSLEDNPIDAMRIILVDNSFKTNF